MQDYSRTKKLMRLVLIFLAASCLFLLNGLGFASTRTVKDLIPGAAPVGNDMCIGCHDGLGKDYQHAYHKQQGVQCEDCHGNGSLHMDGGGDVTKIVSFTKRPPNEANSACQRCHGQDQDVRHWASGSHAANHVRCTDCHQVHVKAAKTAHEAHVSLDTSTSGALAVSTVSPESNVKLRSCAETNEACLRCHATQAGQMSMPYHHPLREGKMSCVDCHNPHGGPGGKNLKVANINQLCLGCHTQYRGPFAYQHPPVSENCMNCHSPHGSPNTNLLSVSEPALCLQCHSGHHNGAALPLPDRCTNCHGSIHGTDVPTPSGGSRFIDKGPSDPVLRSGSVGGAKLPIGQPAFAPAVAAMVLQPVASHAPVLALAGATGANAMARSNAPLASGADWSGSGESADATISPASADSISPASYRLISSTGYLGRVGEYDSLQQSAGFNLVSSHVYTNKHLTVASHARVLSGDDYSAASQLTWGNRLQAGFDMRSFVQQQDHYPFYAFPVLDVPPGATTPPDSTTDLIPSHAVFGITRRMGKAYGRFRIPGTPVTVFANGSWQARTGRMQLGYLDESATPNCGEQCHYISQYQRVNYTTRNFGGGAQAKLGPVQLAYEHHYSSFNNRLPFPMATFTGPFTPENEGYSTVNPPPSGPAPPDVAAGNYPINPPSPSHVQTDRATLSWVGEHGLSANGQASYARLHNTYTGYDQNNFDTDETVNWVVDRRLRLIADYHQHNLINDFTPYYSLYGNVSYHDHSEGLRLNYQLPEGFDVETYYRRHGITRSNAALWPQIYSIDNTDLRTVVPSSFSNIVGATLRYHHGSTWSARAGYEWTGTHQPGYLIIPQSNNRLFASITVTPAKWLTVTDQANFILQNDFPAVPLPNNPTLAPGMGTDISGLPNVFQRRNRFYYETLSATARPIPGWMLGLGYSYQQNNLKTYMAFQNDSSVGYVVNEPAVPYKQITQAYWGDSTYTIKQKLGWNLRLTYNSSRSGMRPDVNPADAAMLGNAALIAQGAFDPNGLFPYALANLKFASTQISGVSVPQWIGSSKAFYRFPDKFEGGIIFYYGTYRDQYNPNLNGVLRTYNLYVGKNW